MRRRRWVRVRVPCPDPPPESAVDLASPQRVPDTPVVAQESPAAPVVEAVPGSADLGRPSTPVLEIQDDSAQPAADGWDCDLPDLDLPAVASSPYPPASPAASNSDGSDDSLTPLLERARSVLLAARSSPASPAATSALRSALVAFLETDQSDEPAPPPSTVPEQVRPVRRELERASFEGEGSLFDLDAGFIARVGSSSASKTVPVPPRTSQLQARRVVTTPERCEPSPRSSLARSWTAGVRSSFEAVTSGGALAD